MKLSDLTPCALCGGKIAPMFYRVRVEMILIDPGKANQVLGLNQYFGGNALRLAEIMAPVDDVTQTVPGSQADLLMCNECFLRGYFSQAYVAHGEEEE